MRREFRILAGRSGFTLLLATLTLSGPAAAVDFKGIELGKPLWIYEEKSVFGKLDCNPQRMSPEAYQRYLQKIQQIVPGVREVCAGTTSIATVPADATVLLGESRRVLRLTFQFAAVDFPLVVKAMTTKWGEGVKENGGQFDESIWWEFDDGSSISLYQAPATVDTADDGGRYRTGLAEYILPATTPAGDL